MANSLMNTLNQLLSPLTISKTGMKLSQKPVELRKFGNIQT
jgi:hypothetical protein